MAGSDGFSTNADLIGEAFAALAESLKAELHPFTNQISMAVEADITTLYGPRLGALWTVKDDVDVLAEGELAHIQAATDDYRVLGYEDGIRPHEIGRIISRSGSTKTVNSSIGRWCIIQAPKESISPPRLRKT